MILLGVSITKIILSILIITLAILILVIAYKKLLRYLGKSAIITEDYCVLYSLENQPSNGDIEIYFTSNHKRLCKIELLNLDLSHHSVIFENEVIEGGNIVRFDTKSVVNGVYFYQLSTENQKTSKKFEILN